MGSIVKPVNNSERISSIDILRGFALLGILLVNVLGFNASIFDIHGYYTHLPDSFQVKFYKIYNGFTTDKFIFIFSFLFGYGIHLQYKKFKAISGNFMIFFSRRMLVLFVFGIAHILFLWAGDILLAYSLAGFLILSLHKLSTKWQLLLAVIFYFSIGIWLVIEASLSHNYAMSADCSEYLEKAKIIYSSGNYMDCLYLRMKEYSTFRNINDYFYLPRITGIMLFGFIASKNLFHQKVVINKPKWSLVLFIIVMISIVLNLGFEKIHDHKSLFATAFYTTVNELKTAFIACCYLLFILIIATNSTATKFLKPIALMGRMSLTNYFMQSVIFSVIFYGWGFGLFGQTKVTLLVMIAILVYTFQVIINIIWFRFYKQGPMESLWRNFSYWKLR